jgi:hypothetical protein
VYQQGIVQLYSGCEWLYWVLQKLTVHLYMVRQCCKDPLLYDLNRPNDKWIVFY